MRVGRGALIVVGGHSRRVGKTSVIEHLLHANAADAWMAVKISAHRHAPASVSVPLVEECREASALTQTGRYLAAGASRAFLVRAPDASLGRVATLITRLREGGQTVVVESNRIVQWLVPDFLVFVVDPGIDDWKPSSRFCLLTADAVVRSDVDAGGLAAEIVSAIPSRPFQGCCGRGARSHPFRFGRHLPSASGS